MRCPKSRFQIQIIVFDELELIIFVSQGLTLSTASLVSPSYYTDNSSVYFCFICFTTEFYVGNSSALSYLFIIFRFPCKDFAEKN